MVKIKIKVIDSKDLSKLGFVKSLKEVSYYGLREAKDIADFLFSNNGITKEVSISSSKEFMNKLKDFGITENQVVVDCKKDKRNENILKLGIGKKENYVDYIVEKITGKIFHDDLNKENSINYIKNILNELNKKEAEKLFKKIIYINETHGDELN
jgi:hypothetical protein